MSEEVKPIYAKGFFTMDLNGTVRQYTVFYYTDPKHYYANLTKEGYRRELSLLRRNMQRFLDEEVIRMNGVRVKAKVIHVNIGLLTVNLPFIEFLITFKGSLRSGVNTYEDEYEEEVTEYPYDIVWWLPGNVTEVSMAGEVNVKDNIITVRVNEGVKVGGRETISFIIDNT
ncbi:hypothetical protein [Caldivirga maquilingensis]|uniref:Uncharacterized protein n=1 Tax=Caldivirga maquilingensis (strain ATCC 700844 / DSM 13496 / JCM 10307 / IC-167) TaxID=397948 RepID=A8MDI2_CALMQ|nr:hypothetical protein [Caldivirga maquilingensis]ABW01838.1 conserved hypothetical protein [Caldivirga maquilingensis IC-167]